MKIRQQLQENDFQRRLQIWHWFEDRCRNPRFLPNYVISDEAGFFMHGKVNTQNIREYVPLGNPPPFNYDVNGSRDKLTVWAAVCGDGSLIGPFFSDGNLNGNIYYEMLGERVFPALMENFEDQFEEDHFRRLWWAQDGAPAPTALQVRELLNEMFQNRVVAIHYQTEWPARSPDLSACDFILWGNLKNKVFTSPTCYNRNLTAAYRGRI